MKDVLLPNTVSQRDNENRITQSSIDDIATAHISKSKLPTLEKKLNTAIP